MKNKIKLFGIIAIVAIIGFAMIACEKEPQENQFTVNETSGRLNITGIPTTNNGKWIYCLGTPDLELGNGIYTPSSDPSDRRIKGVKIVDGNATLKVWKTRQEDLGNTYKNYIFDNYAGNDNSSLWLYITDAEIGTGKEIYTASKSVKFNNGIGNLTW